MMSARSENMDAAEVARFNALASRWWDPAGEMRLLHRMNPVRVTYISQRAALPGARCLDVGCGAGILSESLAAAGAEVTGIDLAEDSLAVARLHQAGDNVTGLTYQRATAEDLAAAEPGRYDIVTCMEMLEHVPDPAAVIAACAKLVRPGGDVFISTINRSPQAYIVTVLGAEHLLGLLPRGTHQFARFIRPSELDAWSRVAGLEMMDIAGLQFDLATGGFRQTGDVRVNFIAHLRRPGP
jgi:2-polyprenyl-6-hydroxyphenyl methylase/3-demethylubiquinone-9 3-methyltransferase